MQNGTGYFEGVWGLIIIAAIEGTGFMHPKVEVLTLLVSYFKKRFKEMN